MNRKIHALIVEDDEAIIRPLSKKLKSLGHEFTVAKNQEEARSCLDGRVFDYILLDLKLPVDSEDMDADSNVGFNVLRQIREKHDKEHHPVIVMTAYGSVEKAVEAMKKGANDFVQKPFPSGEPERQISEILQAKNSEVILCLQALPVNRTFQNFHAEIVIHPGKGDRENPYRLGKTMLRFFYPVLNAKLQGYDWVNGSVLKNELNHDDSADPYWFSKRITHIKKWLSERAIIQHFEFHEPQGRKELLVRTTLSKDQIAVKLPDYAKAKKETLA